MSTIHYTSDLHFFHEKVAKIRGFEDSLTHDRVVVENWRATVKYGDTVYVLGDIAGDHRTTQESLKLLMGLPGEKILIAGNHDPFHPRNKDFPRWQIMLGAYGMRSAPFARRKMLGQDVYMSHFPYVRDRPGVEPRNMADRLRNEGHWLLHGHTHGTERMTVSYGLYENQLFDITPSNPHWSKVRELHAEFPRNVYREIHVGLDAWNLTPVSQDQIIQIMQEF